VAGINSNTNVPYICGFDNIGCIDLSSSFIVAGTATEQLYGMLEALYEPDLEPEQLFETMSQAFLNAVDRDAISGWGVVSYVMYLPIVFQD
jgi:20S proteasome subunit beta 3